VGAALSLGAQFAYFVTRGRSDGTASNTVLSAVDLTSIVQPRHRKLDLPQSLRFAYDQIVVSPDSSRLYLGFGDTVSGFDTINEVRVYDAATLEELAKIDLGGSAIDLAISSEGDHLYVLSAVSQTLAVYDATTMAPLGTVGDLGGTPARILVPGRR
jgi:DNA-binding beta-propeller fold protein YncE